jgi:outer membrane biosynthesis protein TonB
MDRAEATGLGVATAGHVALLAALSLGFAATRIQPPPQQPIEVSFVDAAAPVSSAPDAAQTPPAPLLAPTEGPPEPSPAPPSPAASPPQSQPFPRPQPAQAVPAPASAAHRPTLPKPAPAAPPAKPVRSQTRPTGRLSGLLTGLSDSASRSRSTAPAAAVMSQQAAASIGALIRRQVQPCANRMVNPGPGASRIKVRISLRLARDGSLRAPPAIASVSGVDDENRRYVQRVKELAIAVFTSCSPLHGLPPDLYAVENGWSDFDMTYNLP